MRINVLTLLYIHESDNYLIIVTILYVNMVFLLLYLLIILIEAIFE